MNQPQSPAAQLAGQIRYIVPLLSCNLGIKYNLHLTSIQMNDVKVVQIKLTKNMPFIAKVNGERPEKEHYHIEEDVECGGAHTPHAIVADLIRLQPQIQ